MSFSELLNVFKQRGNFIHVGIPKVKGGSKGATFDINAKNEEINQLLRSNPNLKPEMLTIPDYLKERYSKQYDYWLNQNSVDGKLLRSIRYGDALPPLIVSGTLDNLRIIDGAHRLAVAAKRNLKTIPVYFVK